MRSLNTDTHYAAFGRFTRFNLYGRELLTGHEVKGEECVGIPLTVLMRGQPHSPLWEAQAKLPISINLILHDIPRYSFRLGVRCDGCVWQWLAVTIDQDALNHPPFKLLENFCGFAVPRG